MPANKYALIRYRVIDECLTNKARPFPDKEYLRQACEDRLYGSSDARVSISTIEKDIYAMRYDSALGYEAPIAFHKYNKGYHYTDADFSIKKVPLRDEEVEALQFAAQTLYQFKDVPVFTAFEQVLSKLKEHVSLSGENLNEEYREYMLFEDSEKGTGERYLTLLLKAIREKRKVNLSYSFFQEEKEGKDYILNPYLLKQFRLRWYLLAWDAKAEKVKTFGLDRILSLEVTSEFFLKKEFSAAKYFKDTYGINHTSKPPEQILLKIERPQSKYFLSRPMHPSLRLLRSEEDGDVLSLDLVPNLDLINELMSWAPHVEVLEPELLRKEMIKKIQDLSMLYSKKIAKGKKRE